MQSASPFDLVLFGGTGDLALRKLLPALYRRHAAGQIPPDSRLIGVARADLTREDYLAQVETTCRTYLSDDFDQGRWESFSQHVLYAKFDATIPDDYVALQGFLVGRESIARIFFFSTAPSLFTAICAQFATAGLAVSTFLSGCSPKPEA